MTEQNYDAADPKLTEEQRRAVQANEIAYTVIEVAQNKAPEEFVTLDFRYGIADALWAAGYRKVGTYPPLADDRDQVAQSEAVLYAIDDMEAQEDFLTGWRTADRMRRPSPPADDVREAVARAIADFLCPSGYEINESDYLLADRVLEAAARVGGAA